MQVSHCLLVIKIVIFFCLHKCCLVKVRLWLSKRHGESSLGHSPLSVTNRLMDLSRRELLVKSGVLFHSFAPEYEREIWQHKSISLGRKDHYL